MPAVFDTLRCPVSSIPAIGDFAFLDDCAVPMAPPPMFDCPVLDIDIPYPIGGGPGPGQGGYGTPWVPPPCPSPEFLLEIQQYIEEYVTELELELGGSLITQEQSGLPSVDPTTVLQFAQSDGFAVSEPVPSTALVKLVLSDTLNPVTNMCLAMKRWRYYWMDGETKVPIIVEEVTEEDEDYETAQEVAVGIGTMEKTPIALLPNSVGVKVCTATPEPCCCVDCLCEDITTLYVGETVLEIPLELVSGDEYSTGLIYFMFCPNAAGDYKLNHSVVMDPELSGTWSYEVYPYTAADCAIALGTGVTVMGGAPILPIAVYCTGGYTGNSFPGARLANGLVDGCEPVLIDHITTTAGAGSDVTVDGAPILAPHPACPIGDHYSSVEVQAVDAIGRLVYSANYSKSSVPVTVPPTTKTILNCFDYLVDTPASINVAYGDCEVDFGFFGGTPWCDNEMGWYDPNNCVDVPVAAACARVFVAFKATILLNEDQPVPTCTLTLGLTAGTCEIPP